MADNVGITEGSDKTVATDDVSSVHHQLVKIEHGADGTATMTSSAAPLPTKPGIPVTGDLSAASISAASSGDNTLLAGTGGQTIRVFRLFLVAAAAVNIKFRDGTAGTDLTGAMSLGPGGSVTLDFDGEPWFKTSVANAFVLNLSGAVQVSGRFYYTKS